MSQPADNYDLTKEPRLPKSRPGAAGFMWFLTVVFLLVAAIAIHDAVVARGHVSGPSWFGTASHAIGQMQYGQWVLPAGIILALVGVITMVRSLLPARVRYFPIHSEAAVWMRPVDVCRLCTHAAQEVYGVTRASTATNDKKVTVSIYTAGPASADVVERVREAVTAELEHVDRTLTLTVRPVNKGGQQ